MRSVRGGFRARYRRRKSSKGSSSHVDVQALVLFALVVAAVCALVGSVLLQTWTWAETGENERQHVVSTLLSDGAIKIKGRKSRSRKGDVKRLVQAADVRHRQDVARAKRLRSSNGADGDLSGTMSGDVDAVAAAMKYWHLDHLVDTGVHRLPPTDKYVIFKTDCGGFNNIRMVFEYAVVLAWVTRRTLVLPPPAGWYLIDYGPQTRMKLQSSDARVTHYGEFFDMEHLRAAVPIMTTEEMLRIEGEKSYLPKDLLSANLKSHGGREVWKQWISSGSGKFADLPWSPLQHVIYWPSIEAVKKAFRQLPRNFVHHREPVELTREMNDKRFLALPSCKDNDDYRYLGQVASMIAFNDEALSRSTSEC